MAGLTDKQRLFVEAYIGAAQFNATKAAEVAGYKDPEQAGWENKKKQEVAEAIRRRLSEAAMTADEVLARLADQARGSMDDFLDDAGKIDLARARGRGKLHLVKSRSVTKEGERIELYSAQSALELLARHHGLLIDRQEQGKPGDFAPLPPVREVVITHEPVEPNE